MNDNGTNAFDAGMGFMRMWSDFAASMMQSAMPAAPWMSPEGARQARNTMIETWAKAWDQFLRSPPFLEMMKQSLTGSLQWRQQMNEMLAELQHQFQVAGSQDIDAVLRGQRRLQESLDRIAARLDAIEAQLDAGRPSETDEIELNGHGGPHPELARKRSHRGTKARSAEP